MVDHIKMKTSGEKTVCSKSLKIKTTVILFVSKGNVHLKSKIICLATVFLQVAAEPEQGDMDKGHGVHWLLSGRPTGTAHRALQFAGHLVCGSKTAGGSERGHKPSATWPSLLTPSHQRRREHLPSLTRTVAARTMHMGVLEGSGRGRKSAVAMETTG